MWTWEKPVDKSEYLTVRQRSPQKMDGMQSFFITRFPHSFFNIYKSLSGLLAFPRYYYYYCIYIYKKK